MYKCSPPAIMQHDQIIVHLESNYIVVSKVERRTPNPNSNSYSILYDFELGCSTYLLSNKGTYYVGISMSLLFGILSPS
jgi:hypothetical protein